MEKISINTIKRMKSDGEKITALTAYDFNMAKLLDEVGLEIILVGDSVNMVVYGEENTLSADIWMILRHVKAVSRVVQRALVVADMPFMSYQPSIRDAVRNAGFFLSHGGAKGVKLEGGIEFAPTIQKIVESGIPVMGHLGMLPQSVNKYGGFKVQGKTEEQKEYLVESALALEEAGCFSIVLEKIPAELGEKITKTVSIPTIGIGAGPACDGQILVVNDMLGFFEGMNLKFVRKYANLNDIIRQAVREYSKDVKSGAFPSKDESF
ncbi:3-methyl-2-oxobutanoate hydroxymethyltransferase [bacterium]|nr:3-methyl-2-oxobutanoate hydroxymethyltransferase [bacterium]